MTTTSIPDSIIEIVAHESLQIEQAAISSQKSIQQGIIAQKNSPLAVFETPLGRLQPLSLSLNSQGNNIEGLEFKLNADAISKETPLIIKLKKTQPSLLAVAEEKIVLPFIFDAETGLYLPVGKMNEEGNIVIDQLPQTPNQQRQIIGAIKIFFQEVVLKKQHFPKLRLVKFKENSDDFDYIEDKNAIQEAVQQSNEIVLFVHGIIGDTMDSPKSLVRANISNKYQAVLTFDYESLGTPIEQTSADLKASLEKIGLDATHGKTFHVIAHSMGGLVSRYFVEQLGGDKVVSHLIMLGTPNAGSEIADKLEVMANVLIAIAFNRNILLKPFVIPLANLLGKGMKKTLLHTLFQMHPTTSEFLKKINASPKQVLTPYTIVAGDTGNIEKDENLKTLIQKVLFRYGYGMFDKMVFKEPNDVAVRVNSIFSAGTNTTIKHITGCDHLSYFIDEDGVAAIKDAVEKAFGTAIAAENTAKKRSISVVIPNYNGKKLLEQNLPSVFEALNFSAIDYEVIVPDDASTDDSLIFLAQNYPQIQVVKAANNAGFSANCNRGIQKVTKELVFVLNNDVQLTPAYFEKQFDYFEDKNTFGIMGKTIGLDNDTIQESAKFAHYTLKGFSPIRNYQLNQNTPDGRIPTLYIYGANALYDREKLQKLGGFDEIFSPYYFEDVELSLRAWRLGWACYYEPNAVCRHPMNTTIATLDSKKNISITAKRNKLLLYQIHLNGLDKFFWKVSLIAKWLYSWLIGQSDFYAIYKGYKKLLAQADASKQRFEAFQPVKNLRDVCRDIYNRIKFYGIEYF